ncbi:aspartate ammonia-lyase [Eisenibacter elegans]|jgi:aspartate ammonia-lyase|uniref:aspartate ammonia-lyase n=1 Tax=Eisenibacter elegans TaxID=997 RepID=UPI0009D706FE|nr:aspartate ammonia-lyase [Eisenibacter elegans]
MLRYESDSLGQLPIPQEAYYGIHTERGRQNFDVSGVSIGHFPQFIACLAMVKKAAALANADIGALAQPIAEAICQAADEVISGKIGADQFPVDVIQGGGCVSTHMNINEVLANRANELITGHKGYDFVHPNNHVNMGQSTNDVVPTALKLTLYSYLQDLSASLRILEGVLLSKTEELKDVVKLARTCLQDAVPITFGQSFSAYVAIVQRGLRQLAEEADACLHVPLGATAVGTGLGSRPGYLEAVYPRLREVTALAIMPEENFFDGLQNGDFFVQVSGTVKAVATGLSKMATDLRILSSGNRTGMMEIVLPPVQAGSSIMPGKINPSYPELMNQIAYQICGNDVAITMAVEGIELELNIWDSILSKCLFESCQLLIRSIPLFAHKCIKGLSVNVDICRHQAENTLALALVISVIYGYEVGVKVAKYAYENDLSIKQAAIDLGVLSPELAEELLDPVMLTDVSRSMEITNRLATLQKQKTKDSIGAIALHTRQQIFEVMLRMAWADGTLAQEELLVMEIAAEALQLQLSHEALAQALAKGIQPLTQLHTLQHTEDAAKVYLFAAWLAHVDDELAESEVALLHEIRAILQLDQAKAEALEQLAHEIKYEEAALIPQWENSPWWEQFEQLLVRVAQMPIKG